MPMTLEHLHTLATVTVNVADEDEPPKGYFVTDDPEADAAYVSEILQRLDRGDTWAWCTVTVTAAHDGLSASHSLGACSYRDEQDFRDGGYYEDMVGDVINELHKRLVHANALVLRINTSGLTEIQIEDLQAALLAQIEGIGARLIG